ncbi:hypothetical protein IWQ60_005173 [Tieghemiomyces parasiticus]|uniref:Inner membrane component domain-containing protein n=1 Tax=Tieghemiomyces parasiticus TaxID=78921 RepID=A0A9W8DUV8_9FUNG|nr:hypothetical protein IWQ60_005173 [Tieghemiomyces parasiticus]
MGACRTIGNVIWVILGGWVYFLYYALGGLLFFITIIGIPFGYEAWKLAFVALWPFGKDVSWNFRTTGCLSTVFNIIWLIFLGWHLFLIHLFVALGFAVTIIGLPWAKQSWKLARVALWPFGTTTTTAGRLSSAPVV